MQNETQPDSITTQQTQQSAGPGAGASAPEEFLSLRDILVMIFRHRRAIAAFVLLITLAAGILFILSPRQYEAEGYLQVIPPVSQEGRVDKELYETMIVSHLQRVSSAFIAKNVSVLLDSRGVKIAPLDLEKRVKITRPPKTSLIRIVARETSSDEVLLIVRQWVREYLDSVQKNNIYTALSQVRLLLKQAQSDLMEKQAAVEKMRSQVSQTQPLVTLSRAVDDRQLWSDLTQMPAPNSEAMKKLSEIHIKGQEQNTEYINLKLAMLSTEQAVSSMQARRNLYQEAERILEAMTGTNGSGKGVNIAAEDKDKKTLSESELYVSTLTKSSEIVQFGEPGLISAGRGALKKTGMVFLASLVLACFCAFISEWGKGLLSSR